MLKNSGKENVMNFKLKPMLIAVVLMVATASQIVMAANTKEEPSIKEVPGIENKIDGDVDINFNKPSIDVKKPTVIIASDMVPMAGEEVSIESNKDANIPRGRKPSIKEEVDVASEQFAKFDKNRKNPKGETSSFNIKEDSSKIIVDRVDDAIATDVTDVKDMTGSTLTHGGFVFAMVLLFGFMISMILIVKKELALKEIRNKLAM